MDKKVIQEQVDDFCKRLKAAVKAWKNEKDDTMKIGTTIYKHPQYLQDRKDQHMRTVNEIHFEGEQYIEKIYAELMHEAELASDTLYEPTVGEMEVLKDLSALFISAQPDELDAIFERAQYGIENDTKQAWAFRTAILRAKGHLKQTLIANDAENTARGWARWGRLVQQYDSKHDAGVEIRTFAEEALKQWKVENMMLRPFETLSYADRIYLKQNDPMGFRIATGEVTD